MRIVFIGAVEFSRHCLDEVLKNNGRVVALIAPGDELAKFHSDYASFSDTARKHNIPLYKTKNINTPENVETIKSFKPDVIFIFGWSQLISKEILDIPPLGCIGTHPALLPENRGRHPIIWALVKGLKQSGLSFLYLDQGTDSGDILWQQEFQITLKDNAESVYKKIMQLAGDAIKDFLPGLINGHAPRIPQDHTKATYLRKRTEKDGVIDWSGPTMDTYNLIRGLTKPYVGAHSYIKGRNIKIWNAEIPGTPLPPAALNLQAGTIFSMHDNGFEARAGDGHIFVSEFSIADNSALRTGSRLGI